MYEEETAVFQLPVESIPVAPAAVAEAPVSDARTGIVDDTAKVVSVSQPTQVVDPFSNSDKLSSQMLFDELNAVSEEVIKCRDRVLNGAS